jgi:hypothetical protein
MEYKEFTIKAFQREPGRWRATIQRDTRVDATTAQAALLMAMVEVDALIFSRKLGNTIDTDRLLGAPVTQ